MLEKMNLNTRLRTEEDQEKGVVKFNKEIQIAYWKCTPDIERRLTNVVIQNGSER